MKTEINFSAMSDYLANALDRDSNKEMAGFLQEEFGIPAPLAASIAEAYIKKFLRLPLL